MIYGFKGERRGEKGEGIRRKRKDGECEVVEECERKKNNGNILKEKRGLRKG